MIRYATEEDIPRLLDLGEEFASTLERLPKGTSFSREDVEKVVRHLINSDGSCILVYEKDDIIIGILGGELLPLYFCPQAKNAMEHFFFVTEKARSEGAGDKLMEAFIYWGKEMGAVSVIMVSMNVSTTTHSKEVFEKHGFKDFETAYKKDF